MSAPGGTPLVASTVPKEDDETAPIEMASVVFDMTDPKTIAAGADATPGTVYDTFGKKKMLDLSRMQSMRQHILGVRVVAEDCGVLELKSMHELMDVVQQRQASESLPPCWVDIQTSEIGGASEVILQQFEEVFSLNPYTTADIVNPKSLDKIEFLSDAHGENAYVFAVMYMPNTKEGADQFYDSVAVNMIVMDGFVLTVHDNHLQVSHKIDREITKGLAKTEARIAARLITSITDMCATLVDLVEADTDIIADLSLILTDKSQDDLVKRMAENRRHIAHLRKMLIPKREVLTKLTLFESSLFPSSSKVYLSDPLDDVSRMIEELSVIKESLASSMDTFAMRASLTANVKADKINKVMERLTSLSIMMLPMSVVTGIFGMNVTVPGQTSESNTALWWFTGIVLSFVLIAIISFIGLKRKHLI